MVSVFTFASSEILSSSDIRCLRSVAASKVTTTIDKHGNTVINLYYDRNKHTVYLSGENVRKLEGYGEYDFGATVNVSAEANT